MKKYVASVTVGVITYSLTSFSVPHFTTDVAGFISVPNEMSNHSEFVKTSFSALHLISMFLIVFDKAVVFQICDFFLNWIPFP